MSATELEVASDPPEAEVPAVEEPESPTPTVPDRSEMERLDPLPEEITLTSGTTVLIEPLKTRQFFKMLRIVTRGGAMLLGTLNLDPTSDDFVTQLLGLVLFSLPEAPDEAVDFIKSMVKPKGLTGNRDQDIHAYDLLYEELDNPELDDTVAIVEAVIAREGDDLRALGKRLAGMFRLAERTGQAPQAPKTKGSSGGSAGRST